MRWRGRGSASARRKARERWDVVEGGRASRRQESASPPEGRTRSGVRRRFQAESDWTDASPASIAGGGMREVELTRFGGRVGARLQRIGLGGSSCWRWTAAESTTAATCPTASPGHRRRLRRAPRVGGDPGRLRWEQLADLAGDDEAHLVRRRRPPDRPRRSRQPLGGGAVAVSEAGQGGRDDSPDVGAHLVQRDKGLGLRWPGGETWGSPWRRWRTGHPCAPGAR